MSQINRLMRRMRAGGAVLPCGPYPNIQAVREALTAEQDYRRNNLADELLKVAVDQFHPDSFSDSAAELPADQTQYAKPVVTVESWLVKLAEGALAAATVVYPELPAEEVPGD